MSRLITALAIAAVLVPAIFLLPSVGLLVVALVVMEVALLEYLPIADRLAPGGPYRVLLVALPALVAAPLLADDGPWIAFAVASVALIGGFSAVLRSGTPLEQAAPALGLILLGLCYFGLPAWAFYRLHQLDPWLVFVVISMVVIQDSAAYYVGRSIGRRQLAPRISPNKTWAGAVSGFVAAVLLVGGWSVLYFEHPHPLWLVTGAVAAVAAQLGDLAESALKRGAGIKDSGTLLPGHGGVLDRIDGHLFGSVCFYLGALAIWPPG